MLFIWLYDLNSPFYIARRVGKDGKIFRMIKFRSMILNADKTGIVSTSSNDSRLTPIGKIIRKYKIDELLQLINVIKGEMSLVGPRPNVELEVKLYTIEERKILSVKPGITDFSSIIFSDLNEILKEHPNVNLSYNQLVRPWKSRLAILYVLNNSLILDLKLILITVIGIFNRKMSLKLVNSILKKVSSDEVLIKVSLRQDTLYPYPPPGMNRIVEKR